MGRREAGRRGGHYLDKNKATMRPGLPPAPASLGHWNSGFALVEERAEQGSKVWRYPSKKRSRQGVTVCLNPSTQKGEEDKPQVNAAKLAGL